MSNSALTRRIASLRLALALTVALTAISPAVLADPSVVAVRGQATKYAVRYDDLNLQSETGAQTLLNRLALAATDACGGAPASLGPIERKALHWKCKKVAIRDAVRTVDVPTVSAAFERKIGTVSRMASR